MQDLKWSSIDFKVKEKSILSDCWGSVPAGKVCAILGPSGAGKVRDKCDKIIFIQLFTFLYSHHF